MPDNESIDAEEDEGASVGLTKETLVSGATVGPDMSRNGALALQRNATQRNDGRRRHRLFLQTREAAFQGGEGAEAPHSGGAESSEEGGAPLAGAGWWFVRRGSRGD